MIVYAATKSVFSQDDRDNLIADCVLGAYQRHLGHSSSQCIDSGAYSTTECNLFNTLIFNEAHSLNAKPHVFQELSENLVIGKCRKDVLYKKSIKNKCLECSRNLCYNRLIGLIVQEFELYKPEQYRDISRLGLYEFH